MMEKIRQKKEDEEYNYNKYLNMSKKCNIVTKNAC
jgi:hypothetical protein